jgi:hypothetical protein
MQFSRRKKHSDKVAQSCFSPSLRSSSYAIRSNQKKRLLTISFQLPLSVVTGVFGMNAKEINGGGWTVRKEMIFMSNFLLILAPLLCPNTSAASPDFDRHNLTSFILAFSSFMLAFLSFIIDLAWTKFVTSTQIYDICVELPLNSKKLSKIRSGRTTK